MVLLPELVLEFDDLPWPRPPLDEDLPPLHPLPEFRPLPWNLPIVTFHGKLQPDNIQ